MKGQVVISLGVGVTIIAMVASGVFAAMGYLNGQIKAAVDPVSSQTETNTTDIAVLKTQLADIKANTDYLPAVKKGLELILGKKLQ